MFLTPSVDNQTCNYDIKGSNHHPSLSTLRPNRLGYSKMKWWAIHTNIPVHVMVRLRYPRSGDSQNQEMFLAPSADKQTRNYHTECSKHHQSLSSLKPKWLDHSKMKCWAIYTNLQVDVTVRVPHLGSGDNQCQKTFLEPYADKQTRNYDIECSNNHPSLSTLRQKELRARWNGEPYIQIYHWKSQSDYPIVGMERSRTRERFSTLCLQANPQL